MSSLRLAVEEAHPDGEDDVEATFAEIKALEARNEKLGLPGLDEPRIAASCCVDHPRGAIDRSQPALVEPLADHRRGDSVPS